MINWITASLDEVDAHLDAMLARQKETFPANAAAYAAEQRAPDNDDDTQDYG